MKSKFKSRLHTLSIALTVLLLTAALARAVSAATIITSVDSAGGYSSAPLRLNSNGFPVISYWDGGNSDLKVAVCGNATCTSGNTITTVDSIGRVGLQSSMALNSSGFPVISYWDMTNNNLKVAVCGNATCTSGNTITTVDTGKVGQHTSLALNSSGFPVISYWGAANNDMKVAVCGNAKCTAGNTITTVDSNGGGMYTSLALNSSGYPVISYYDFHNGDLKVAACGNAICTAGNTITAVDSDGIVGPFTSLALNSSGFPVISYRDHTNEDLKVAVCGNASCTSGNTLTTVDSAGVLGTFTSLKLNSSGFPIISYRDDGGDNTKNDLKVAVCGNAACTAGNTFITVDNMEGYTSLVLNSSGFPVISYYAAPGGLKLAVVDTILAVTNTNLLTNYVTTGPSAFTVTFSKAVNDPAGDTNKDDVTNPANYLVVNKGANGVWDTVSCKLGTAGDDTKATVSRVTYAHNTATVTLASALPVGNYRLFVCGTTSIVDMALNPLGGGVDYTFDFTVESSGKGERGNNANALTLPRTGFTPFKITNLATQPAELAYTELGYLWLDIPSLKVKANIVGVPQSENVWDVKWLGQDAGWLNGTAFPTWEGNSVITSHVTDSNGLPGPFADIKSLKYGDQIIVHLYDEQYVFEVRNKRLVRPETTDFAFEHLKDHSYLTLITCQSYDPATDSYRLRRVIRAVLVEVK